MNRARLDDGAARRGEPAEPAADVLEASLAGVRIDSQTLDDGSEGPLDRGDVRGRVQREQPAGVQLDPGLSGSRAGGSTPGHRRSSPRRGRRAGRRAVPRTRTAAPGRPCRRYRPRSRSGHGRPSPPAQPRGPGCAGARPGRPASAARGPRALRPRGPAATPGGRRAGPSICAHVGGAQVARRRRSPARRRATPPEPARTASRMTSMLSRGASSASAASTRAPQPSSAWSLTS